MRCTYSLCAHDALLGAKHCLGHSGDGTCDVLGCAETIERGKTHCEAHHESWHEERAAGYGAWLKTVPCELREIPACSLVRLLHTDMPGCVGDSTRDGIEGVTVGSTRIADPGVYHGAVITAPPDPHPINFSRRVCLLALPEAAEAKRESRCAQSPGCTEAPTTGSNYCKTHLGRFDGRGARCAIAGCEENRGPTSQSCTAHLAEFGAWSERRVAADRKADADRGDNYSYETWLASRTAATAAPISSPSVTYSPNPNAVVTTVTTSGTEYHLGHVIADCYEAAREVQSRAISAAAPKPKEQSAMSDLKDNAAKAVTRTAGRIATVAAQAPITGLFRRYFGDDAAIAAFLASDFGKAFTGFALGVGVKALPDAMIPESLQEYRDEFADELQTEAISVGLGEIAALLVEPLTAAAEAYARGKRQPAAVSAASLESRQREVVEVENVSSHAEVAR